MAKLGRQAFASYRRGVQFSRLKRLLFLAFHAYIRTAFEVNCLVRFYFGLQRQKGRTASKKRDADVDK
jgi:hypothetical protein